MPESSKRLVQPAALFRIGVVVLAVLLLAGVVGLMVTQAAPDQPFPFAHAPHNAQGIDCQYCHPGTARGATAGLPTRAKCLGCHGNLPANTEGRQAVWDYIQNNQEFIWAPVAMLPDFVYFTHQPHIAAGVNCENCHGDVGRMMAAEPVTMNMGWCLDCHQKRAPEKFEKLSDCATCHH